MSTETKELTDEDKAFYGGMIAALGVVHLYGHQTMYEEIMRTINKEELIQVCLENGYEDAEWAGLVAYGYVPERSETEGVCADE